MFVLGRPRPERLEAALVRAGAAAVTFRADTPSRYRHDRDELELGRGDDAWNAACEGLRRWAAHAGAGATVTPPGAPLTVGTTVIVALALGPVTMVAPCRIVHVVHGPNQFGFTYATLAGHPEEGEESFVVERDQGGAVRFVIEAWSRPRALLPRLGTPVTRLLQGWVTRRYLEGLRRFLTGGVDRGGRRS